MTASTKTNAVPNHRRAMGFGRGQCEISVTTIVRAAMTVPFLDSTPGSKPNRAVMNGV